MEQIERAAAAGAVKHKGVAFGGRAFPSGAPNFPRKHIRVMWKRQQLRAELEKQAFRLTMTLDPNIKRLQNNLPNKPITYFSVLRAETGVF